MRSRLVDIVPFLCLDINSIDCKVLSSVFFGRGMFSCTEYRKEDEDNAVFVGKIDDYGAGIASRVYVVKNKRQVADSD